MTRCDLTDLYWIWELVSETDDSPATYDKLKNTLGHPGFWYWKDELKSVLMIFFPVDADVYAMHIYTKKEARGQYAARCAMKAGLNMVDCEPDIQCFFNIVQRQDRHLRMFMRYIGSKKAVTLPNKSIMYVIKTDEYDEIQKRIGE